MLKKIGIEKNNISKIQGTKVSFFKPIVVLVTLVFFTNSNAYGANSYYYDQLNNTKNKLKRNKDLVQHLKKKEVDAKINLSVVQRRLENTQVKLADTQYRYEEAQRKIQLTNIKLKETDGDLKKQVDSTKSTLLRMYKHKYTDYLMFLFKSDDVYSFMRKNVYYTYLIDQDNKKINSLTNKKKEIKDLKDEYTKNKTQIVSIAKTMAKQKVNYESETERQEVYLRKVKNEKSFYEKEVRLLEQESSRVTDMLKNIKKTGSSYSGSYSVPYSGGRMGWPCGATTITSNFGYRIHPIFGTRKLHAGLDIGASEGTPIYAAANGVVVESGWTGGYGKAVIINHGSGIATLYAHSSVLYVAPGQRVKRGQLIAAVGSTGFSTGGHLHFEVRVNGSPTDPLTYLR
ncbi:MAG: peptidoglycan DD-metalloendopeptidase family protein [Cyanobacteriota bacterium]